MSIKPDVVIQLTPEQLELIAPLKAKQKESAGMILGSVGIEQNKQTGDTIALSYIPQRTALAICTIAEHDLGGKNVETEK